MDADTRKAVRDAFLAGQLRVDAVDPLTGKVGLHPVSDILRHNTGHKRMVRLVLDGNREGGFTEDHSVFTLDDGKIIPVKAGGLTVGDRVVVIKDGVVSSAGVRNVVELPPEEHTYDLSVPGPENFMLTNGILAHNTYSIGGVSLDIEKASKYQTMKDAADAKFTPALEAKQKTVLFIRGLQQPRFSLGVRSAFGPAVGRGILSPRSFV